MSLTGVELERLRLMESDIEDLKALVTVLNEQVKRLQEWARRVDEWADAGSEE